jgi:hypothetical protein
VGPVSDQLGLLFRDVVHMTNAVVVVVLHVGICLPLRGLL